jgi:hypothetical protein
METTENTQIEAVSEGLLDQDHKAKRHKDLIRDPTRIPQRYGPKSSPRKFQEKATKITKNVK